MHLHDYAHGSFQPSRPRPRPEHDHTRHITLPIAELTLRRLRPLQQLMESRAIALADTNRESNGIVGVPIAPRFIVCIVDWRGCAHLHRLRKRSMLLVVDIAIVSWRGWGSKLLSRFRIRRLLIINISSRSQ